MKKDDWDVLVGWKTLEELLPNQSEEAKAINKVLMSLPPAGGTTAVPNIQQYVGIINAVNKFYKNPDEAIRASRTNARNMLRSLAIREPLQARMLAVAELPGHVEPPNKKDKFQLAVAKEVQQVVEEIPDFLKFKIALLWAVWFGKSGVQNEYRWDFSTGRKRLAVRRWSPVHGDSIVHKWDSDNVGVLVGQPLSYGRGTKQLSTEATDVSRAHVLTGGEPEPHWLQNGWGGMPNEREAFVIHYHDLLAGDFFEPEAAGGVKGVGLRSVVYWTWYVMHEISGWLLDFMERIGTGFTIFYFDQGNSESYAKVRELAESQSNSNIILWPRQPGQTQGAAGIERIEPTPTGVDNLLKVLDGYFGSQIRRYIQGQDGTSMPVPAGLNSDTAKVHENTFARIVKFDAQNLSETLTRDLIWPIQRWTVPEAGFKLRYVIAADKPNVKEYMEGVKAFFDMGGAVDEDEVRSVIGLSKPDADAAVLKKQESPGQLPGLPGMKPPLLPQNSEKDDDESGKGGPDGKPFPEPRRFLKDDEGHEHDKEGKFTSKGGAQGAKKTPKGGSSAGDKPPKKTGGGKKKPAATGAGGSGTMAGGGGGPPTPPSPPAPPGGGGGGGYRRTKNIDDAESFAKGLGVGTVQYRDSDPAANDPAVIEEIANNTNEALDAVKARGINEVPRRIEVSQLYFTESNTRGTAWAVYVHDPMSLSGLRSNWIRMNRAIIINPRPEWANVANEVDAMYRTGQISTNDPHHYIYHELGHFLWYERNRRRDARADNQAFQTGLPLVRSHISGRAATGVKEFVSEVFAQKVVGVTPVHPTVEVLYRQLGGPAV